MKKLFFTATAAVLLAACSNSGNSTEDKKDSSGTTMNNTSTMDSKRERNEKTALASVQGINAHDADVVLKDVTADAVDYGDGSMPQTKGLDSIKVGMKGWFAAFPDVKGENLEAFSNADGSKVIVFGEWTGTFKNDFMGMKPTNKSYKLWDGDILTFNDEGKITSHRSVQSSMVMMSQLGVPMPK